MGVTDVMQKYHAAADSVCDGAFATNRGFCPLHFVRRNIF
jgi:hypothetical protein